LPTGADQVHLAQAVLDSVSDLILWSDPSGRLIYANRAACSMLEYDHEELLEKSVQDIAPDLSGDAWPQHWRSLKQKRKPHVRDRAAQPLWPPHSHQVATHYVTHKGREYTSASLRDTTERSRAQQDALNPSSNLRRSFANRRSAR